MKKFKCWLSETICWVIASMLFTMVISAVFLVAFCVANYFKISF